MSTTNQDHLIDEMTQNAVAMVNGADQFGITTACFIAGEFVLVSKYDINSEMEKQLRAASYKQGAILGAPAKFVRMEKCDDEEFAVFNGVL